ncbi:MAG: conjugative transposon protein TraM [Bacteroidetes bacterium]|nr:MAG: conjugative transposon protein TraM [Bacteroidota bacterium]
MKQTQHSARFLKQRKFLLMLPLLVLPFIIIVIGLLARINRAHAEKRLAEVPAGINKKLPDPHFKKAKPKDKLAIYDESEKDSLRIKEKMKNDPFYKYEFHEADTFSTSSHRPTPIKSYLELNTSKNFPVAGIPQKDQNAEKLELELEKLNQVLKNNAAVEENNERSLRDPSFRGGDYVSAAKVSVTGQPDRMAKMKELMNLKSEPDPEMEKISKILDKILLIQHPGKAGDSVISKHEFFDAGLPVEEANISVVDNSDTPNIKNQNQFFGLADPSLDAVHNKPAIEAVTDETQTILPGESIRLRLMQDMKVKGSIIHAGDMIYGVSSLSAERLNIKIESVNVAGNILPVSLEVYDEDGLRGIFIPGSVNRDAAREGSGQVMNAIGLTSLDPSLGAQAASAGIQAAKSLMNRKIRLVHLTVKAGYHVLLKNSSVN